MTDAYDYVQICSVNDLRENNSDSTSSLLIFRYALVYLLCFTIGLISYYVFDLPFTETLNGYVNSHFTTTFNTSSTLSNNIGLLITVSYADIRTLALIFVAGFTMFSSVAIYSLLGYHALSVGLSSLYLVNSLTAGKLSGVNFLDVITFLISNAAIASVLIIFSSKSRIFNDEFKRLGGRKKLIIRSKPLYHQIFTLFTVCGAILFINIIRFVLNIF